MVKLLSVAYRGEWPAGVYWDIGEVREVVSAAGAPNGLEVVVSAKSPGKSAAAPRAAK